MKIRLLPFFIVFIGMILCIRVVTVYHQGSELVSNLRLEEKSAYASEEAAKGGHDNENLEAVVKDKEEKKDGHGEEAKHDATEAPAPAAEGEHTADKPEGEAAHGTEAAAPAAPAEETHVPGEFSDAELDVLQSLSERRQALDARERELERRMALVQAAETRLASKTQELRTIEEEIKTARNEIESLVTKYDAQEDAKIKSLILTYEKMKPKEAADIFNKLDLEIVLNIIQGMKETKMAAILAAMDPERAEKVTMELAKPRNLPSIIQNSVEPKAN